jgi:LAO/AO transport system kinase
MSLVDNLLNGDRRALARAITQVENREEGASETLAALYSHTGRAHRIGITGASGSGKSTLVNALARMIRQAGLTVGIIAVDPTSPFSGGAILGDRIRMRDLAGDSGIFIRSMASRGSLGGLASATADVAHVLDAAGYDTVLIETVGAGQSEIDIARHAHTVLVIEAPGMGDDVQAIKAGILEIADVLVVNKADDPRADNTFYALRAALELSAGSAGWLVHDGELMTYALPEDFARRVDGWEVPIHKTIATQGEGVCAVWEAIQAHRAYLESSGELRRREHVRTAAELDRLLREALLAHLLARLNPEMVANAIEQVMARRLEPHAAVALLLEQSGVKEGEEE